MTREFVALSATIVTGLSTLEEMPPAVALARVGTGLDRGWAGAAGAAGTLLVTGFDTSALKIWERTPAISSAFA